MANYTNIVPRKPVPVKEYERKSTWIKGCLVYPSCHSVARRLYERRHGKLPRHILVCHTCDNPWCILDAHHFAGTQSDNVKDSVRKGRHACLRKQSMAEKTKRSETLKATLAKPEHRAVRVAINRRPEHRKAVSKAAKEMWQDKERRTALLQKRSTPKKRKQLVARAKQQKRVGGKWA